MRDLLNDAPFLESHSRYSRPSHSMSFEKALRDDFKWLTESYMKFYNIDVDEAYESINDALIKSDDENVHIISDLFGGLTENKCKGKYKHDRKYWEGENALVHEAFAHFFGATVTSNKTKIDVIKETFPTAYEEFIKILDELE